MARYPQQKNHGDNLNTFSTSISISQSPDKRTQSVATANKLYTHPFNGSFSGTTRVSRYQKGKTDLDFTEARVSEWQWNQLGRMQVCNSLQTDNHTSTPPLSFLQAGCPSCRPTNSVKALKARQTNYILMYNFTTYYTTKTYKIQLKHNGLNTVLIIISIHVTQFVSVQHAKYLSSFIKWSYGSVNILYRFNDT